MTRPLVFLVLFLVPVLSQGEASVSSAGSKGSRVYTWSAVNTQTEQAKVILKAVRSWQGKKDKDAGKKLRVAYFHPKDRKPLKDHVSRWNGIMNDVQDFYRSEMKRLGYGEVLLGLERENGKLKLHEVSGKDKDDGSYTYKSGGKIKGEVFNALQAKGINPQEETILIVCGLSKTEGKKQETKRSAPRRSKTRLGAILGCFGPPSWVNKTSNIIGKCNVCEKHVFSKVMIGRKATISMHFGMIC